MPGGVPRLLAAGAAGAVGAVGPAGSRAPADLAECAELLHRSEHEAAGSPPECRTLLLGALARDEVPGYAYRVQDCHFWAHYGVRDRAVEGARLTDFNRLAELRLSEPFSPPLRPNATMLYVGAHRTGDDGAHFHRHHRLRVHLFEPSPSFFGDLQRALGGVPGFTLHNYGLGAQTRRMRLLVSGTASRTLENRSDVGLAPGRVEEVLVRAAAEAAPDVLGGGAAELLHVNCEGCEYDVIEGISDAGHLAEIPQVQIATHMLDHQDPNVPFLEAMALSVQVSARRYCQMHGRGWRADPLHPWAKD
ncbi:unnamed protein product [Prorocentrum cordatum]|uniref:Methyltransferase FkbM domain-containing protein n=1 Tax=Prorocentrum cordatum TaxID=2364126 RepID=A0ABN9TLT4_9DINO|nr:unnamed protein product [Polarella glacialis]